MRTTQYPDMFKHEYYTDPHHQRVKLLLKFRSVTPFARMYTREMTDNDMKLYGMKCPSVGIGDDGFSGKAGGAGTSWAEAGGYVFSMAT